MTKMPLVVALPLLRGPLPCRTSEIFSSGCESAPYGWTGALRLWPGLPGMPEQGWFCPGNYPFSPQEAAVCRDDLRQMTAAALTGLPVGASSMDNARAARRSSEMALLAGLADFCGNTAAARVAEDAHNELIERQQAQKILIWTWQQEEALAELIDLAAKYMRNADSLSAALGAESYGEAGGKAVKGLASDLMRLDAPVPVDAGLMPPWRLVTANALYFLPLEAAIAVEGSMCEELPELLDFTPSAHWTWALGESSAEGAVPVVEILEARAPGWKLLGRTRPTGQAPLDAERIWLVWRARS